MPATLVPQMTVFPVDTWKTPARTTGGTQLRQRRLPTFRRHAGTASPYPSPTSTLVPQPSARPLKLYPSWAPAPLPPSPIQLARRTIKTSQPPVASSSILPAPKHSSNPYGHLPAPSSANRLAQVTDDRRRYKNHNIALKEREKLWQEEKAALEATLQEREAHIGAQASELSESRLLAEELRETSMKRDVAAKIQCSLLHERLVEIMAEKSKVDLELCQLRHDIFTSLRMPVAQRR